MIKITRSAELSTSLPAMQAYLRGILVEYEAKISRTRDQLAHIDALLSSLSVKTVASGNVTNYRKRPSLFGSDKDRIIIGKKFDFSLVEEFQDFV